MSTLPAKSPPSLADLLASQGQTIDDDHNGVQLLHSASAPDPSLRQSAAARLAAGHRPQPAHRPLHTYLPPPSPLSLASPAHYSNNHWPWATATAFSSEGRTGATGLGSASALTSPLSLSPATHPLVPTTPVTSLSHPSAPAHAATPTATDQATEAPRPSSYPSEQQDPTGLSF